MDSHFRGNDDFVLKVDEIHKLTFINNLRPADDILQGCFFMVLNYNKMQGEILFCF